MSKTFSPGLISSFVLLVDLAPAAVPALDVGGGTNQFAGVGHCREKNNTGQIQVNMLTTSCTGTGCCAGYAEVCGNHN